MADITLADFYSLRSLLLGGTVPWTSDSLHRCLKAGHINNDGSALTEQGAERAQVFHEYVEALWRGIPLTVPRKDLTEFAEESVAWNRDWIGNNRHHQFDENFVIFADTNEHIMDLCQKMSGKDSRELVKEWKFKIRSKFWVRCEPYAYQAEPKPGGLKVICFRGAKHSTSETGWHRGTNPARGPKVVRVQAHYYDYVISRFPQVTWWWRPTKNPHDQEVAARVVGDRDYLGRGFVALVCRVNTTNWPVPLYHKSLIPGIRRTM